MAMFVQKLITFRQFARFKLQLLMGLGFCLLTGGIFGDSAAEMEIAAESELNKLHVAWVDQFWVYLESSETEQFRVASGIRLTRSSDTAAKNRGERLIAEALSIAKPTSASLWLIASECALGKSSGWCELAGVYDRLAQADPGNVATSLLRISQLRLMDALESQDTEVNRQLLLEAAEGDHYDSYWGRNADKLYAEALEFLASHEYPPIPGHMLAIFPHGFPEYANAFSLTAMHFGLVPTVAYSNILELCRTQIKQQRNDTIRACKKLAGILRNSGHDFVSKDIGYAMEKTMLATIDPDDPGIQKWWRRQQVFHIRISCASQGWLSHIEHWSEVDQQTMMTYLKNLSEWGEIRAIELSNRQEYTAAPEHFTVNPIECEKLQYLDDAAIQVLLNGQNAQQFWRTFYR